MGRHVAEFNGLSLTKMTHMPIDKSVNNPKQSTPSTAIPDDLVELGRILGGHGIRGWVKIQPFSAEADAMMAAKQWWLASANRVKQSTTAGAHVKDKPPFTPTLVNVSWAKAHGQFFLAEIKGIADRNASDALKGQSVFVSRQLFPPLEPDEYYWVDLLGCVVMTDATEQPSQASQPPLPLRLGVVHEVVDNPAHPLLAVKRQQLDLESGTWIDQHDAKDRLVISLIPFVSAHVESVNLAERLINTHWPADF